MVFYIGEWLKLQLIGAKISVLKMFDLPYFLDMHIEGQVASIFLELGKVTVLWILFWKILTKNKIWWLIWPYDTSE